MHTGLHMQIQGRQTGSAIVHGAPWRAKLGSTAMHLGFRQPTSMNVYSPPQVKVAIVPNAGAERRGLGYVSILMDRSYLPYVVRSPSGSPWSWWMPSSRREKCTQIKPRIMRRGGDEHHRSTHAGRGRVVGGHGTAAADESPAPFVSPSHTPLTGSPITAAAKRFKITGSGRGHSASCWHAAFQREDDVRCQGGGRCICALRTVHMS